MKRELEKKLHIRHNKGQNIQYKLQATCIYICICLRLISPRVLYSYASRRRGRRSRVPGKVRTPLSNLNCIIYDPNIYQPAFLGLEVARTVSREDVCGIASKMQTVSLIVSIKIELKLLLSAKTEIS